MNIEKKYLIIRDSQVYLGSKKDIGEKDILILGGEIQTSDLIIIDKDKKVVRALTKKLLDKMGLDIDSKMLRGVFYISIGLLIITFISMYISISRASKIGNNIDKLYDVCGNTVENKDEIVSDDVENIIDDKVYIETNNSKSDKSLDEIGKEGDVKKILNSK